MADLRDNTYLRNIFSLVNPSVAVNNAINSQKIRDTALGFGGSFGMAMNDLMGGFNGLVSKGLKRVGADRASNFFAQNRNYWRENRQGLENAQSYGNGVVNFVGEMAGDPLTYLTGMKAIQGGKNAIKTMKNMAGGGALFGGDAMLKTYNAPDMSFGDRLKTAGISAGAGALANGLVSSKTADTLARKAWGALRPVSKTAENGFANIAARDARWANENARQQSLNAFREQQQAQLARATPRTPQGASGSINTNQSVLDNVLNMTNPQRNIGQAPYRGSINTNEMARPPFRQSIANEPVNNPNLANPNMRSAFVRMPSGEAMRNAGSFVARNSIGTIGGGVGGYAYGGDIDSALAGAIAGTLGQHGLYRGGKYLYNRMPLMGTDKALEKGYANFSYETIPSSHLDPKKYPLESELYNTLSKPENSNLSAKYENEVYRTKLFNDTAHKLGLKFKDMGQKTGHYNDTINGELKSVNNPSRQVQIKPEYDKDGNLKPEFERKMQILSAVMGKGLKQDAVTWHIPNTKTTNPNGVSVNLGGREINANTLQNLDETLGKGNYGFIPDADGKSVRIIDFNGNTINPSSINKALKDAGYNTQGFTPFDTRQMANVRDFGYMGNQDHFEPKWQYSQDYYDDLLKDSANGTNANIFRDTNIYPNIFGDTRQIFKGETAERQWQDFIDKRQDTINKIGEKLREKPVYSQTQIPRTNNQKGFITPNVASNLATSGTGALIGASQDSENRLRGALIGAGAGLAGNRFIQAGAKAYFKNQTDNLAQNLPNIAKANPKLFNQIADRSLQGAYKSEQKGMREGFIAGEKKANLGETHKANLAAAKTLEKNGANELEIWEKTGWYKDELDNSWKVEINPNGGDLNAELLYKVKNSDSNYNGKLSDILQDKELYSAYPQFRDINVEIAPLSEGQAGGFNRKTNTLIIGKNQNRDEALKTIYHEVQHAIQNTEGFSGGTNLGKAIDYAMKNKLDVSKSVNYYARQAGEAEARNVEKRLDEAGRTAIREGAPLNTKLSLEQYKAIEGKRIQMAMDRANHPKTKAMYADMKSRLDNMNEADFANLRANERYTAHPLNTLDIPRNERLNMDSVNTSAKNDIAKMERTQNIANTLDARNSIGKDFMNDLNALEKGYISRDDFLKAWDKADNGASGGNGNGGNIPPKLPPRGNGADDFGDFDNLGSEARNSATQMPKSANEVLRDEIIRSVKMRGIGSVIGGTYGGLSTEEGENRLANIAIGAGIGAAAGRPIQTLKTSFKGASKIADIIGNIKGVKQAINAYDKAISKGANTADNYWNAFWAKAKDEVFDRSKKQFEGMSISDIAKQSQAEFAKRNPNVSDDIGMKFATSYAENMVKKDFADITRRVVGSSENSFGENMANTVYNIKQFFKEAFTDTKGASYNVAYDKYIASKNGFTTKMSDLQNTLLKIDEKDRVALHNFLVGEDKELGTTLPKHLEPLAHTIRKQIDSMSDALVREGLIDEAVANELKGQYIHRVYDRVNEQFKDHIARNTNSLEKMHHRGKREFVLSKKDHELKLQNNKEYAKKFDMAFNKGGYRAVTKNGKVEIYRDYTPAERTAMNEVRDSAHTIPQTLMYMHTLAENNRFLKELSELKGGEILNNTTIRQKLGIEPSTNLIKQKGKIAKDKLELDWAQEKELNRLGYVKMPKDAKWGALSDKWIRRDIADSLKGSKFFNMDELNWLSKTFQRYATYWKKSKTVFSQTAHINNVLSNVSLMYMSGASKREIMRGYGFGGEALGLMKRYDELKAMRGYNGATPMDNALFKELETLEKNPYIKAIEQGRSVGLFGRSMLHDIENGFVNPVSYNTQTKGVWGKVKQGWNKFDKTTSDLYQDEDNLGRLIMFKHYMDKGMSANEAKRAVNSFIPDYTRTMPKGVRALRDTMVAPFISWSYYVMPSIAKYMAQHPASAAAKLLPIFALGAGLQYKLSGISPKDEWNDDIKPSEFQGRKIAIARNGDRVTTYEMSRIAPQANIIDPRNTPEYVKGLVSGPATQFAFNVGDIVRDRNLRKFYNGRSVTYANKSKKDKLIDYAKYGSDTYAPIPGVVNSAFGLANTMIREPEKRRTNSVYSPKTSKEQLAKFLGFNTTSYDMNELKRENIKEAKKKREAELKKLRGW